MAEIQWNALQTPDFGANALKSWDAGRTRSDADAKRNALRMYATDPEAGIAQLTAFDPVAAMALRKARAEQQAEEIRRSAGTMAAAGNSQGAQAAALGGGQFDLAKSIADMDSASRKAASERAERLASFAYGIKDLPYEARKQRLMDAAPSLGQFGLTPEQIAGFDPSDANIDAQIATAMSIKEQLEQADKATDNQRADAQFEETKRAHRVGEGISQRNASTSAFSAQTGRMSFNERKKAKGFGTPGVGGKVLGPTLDPNDGW